MTTPAPPPGRHTKPGSLTRITISAELPPGVDALMSVDGRTLMIRAGIDRFTRRRAIREVRDAAHRFPRFPGLVIPLLLADARIRRFLITAGDTGNGWVQHAAAVLTPDSAGVAAAVTAVVVGAAGVTGAGIATGTIPVPVIGGPPAAAAPARPGQVPGITAPPVRARLPVTPAGYLGVFEPSHPPAFAPVAGFSATVGHHVNLALYYSGWGEPFQSGFATAALTAGAWPVVQMNPDQGTSIKGIAAGEYDKYLTSFAAAVHAYGNNPVVIGFGHEMNADWYKWGFGHVSPAVWVAAWRHIVDLFRAAGDLNVTWLWTVNVETPGKTGPDTAAWWPGAGYVTWVGIDGYYYSPAANFGSVFGGTLADVHTFAGQTPVLISETAADPPEQPEARQIMGLFAAIGSNQILGLIWFDENIAGRQWRIEGNPEALAAFRKAARGYGG